MSALTTQKEADDAMLANAGHVRAIFAIGDDGVRFGIREVKHHILLGAQALDRENKKMSQTSPD